MEAKVLETIDKEKLYTDYHDMVLGYIMHHIGNLDVAENYDAARIIANDIAPLLPDILSRRLQARSGAHME